VGSTSTSVARPATPEAGISFCGDVHNRRHHHACYAESFSYLAPMGEYSLGEALRNFLQKSQLKGSIQALQIEEVWEQIMGKTVARYTDKITIQGQTLFVNTTVAALRQELLYQKENIIKRVNEALGETVIKEVVIR
jgi:hypothetical protein